MAKKNAKQNLNVLIDEKLVQFVKADAAHFRKTLDGIVEASLRSLFSLKREEREKFYKYLPAKILGRPITIKNK